MTDVVKTRGTRLSRWVAGAIVAMTGAAGIVALPTAAQAASGSDGLTSETAAASCWEIKQNDPTSKDGVYWLVTPALVYPQQFYCDQTTDGGGWVLIGRGREGWKEEYNGWGTPEAIRNTPSGTSAFAPAELPAKTIDGLLNNGRVDALQDGIRLRRATNTAGTSWQEAKFRLANRDRWVWTFGADHPVKDVSFTSSAGTVTGTGGRTAYFGTDYAYNSINFFQDEAHKFRMGWSFGTNVQGTEDAGSYMWAPAGKGCAIPFTQTFIRPQLRLADLNFGSVSTTGTPASTVRALPSSGAMKTTWGVSGLANGNTSELNVEVAAFAESGGKVFVGGNFKDVQQSRDGAGQVEQSYLAAFDVKTGAWVPTFVPKLDGQVKAIAALPDGRIAIGGQFSTVNGVSQPGLAILDASTGQLSGWQVKAEHRATGAVPYIRGLDVQNGYLYVAGSMTHLTAVGSTTSASTWNGGRIALSTGKPDTN